MVNNLADIELPSAPADDASLALWLVLVVVILVGVITYIAWRKRGAMPNSVTPGVQAALAQLEQIQKQWQLGQLDERQAAYRLATLLRLALGLPQLDSVCPPCVQQHRAQWPNTIALLTTLRYRRVETQNQLNTATFDVVRQWLQTRGRG